MRRAARLGRKAGFLALVGSLIAVSLMPAAAVADGCPNAAFRTGLSADLPDCRAYEKVSPADKNGGDVERSFLTRAATSGASFTGDAVAYASRYQFADIESGAPYAQYRSHRVASGWVTRGISAPLDPDPNQNGPLGSFTMFLSGDLRKTVVRTNSDLAPGWNALLNGSWGLYSQDLTTPVSGYQLLSAPDSPLSPNFDPTFNFRDFEFVAATPDLGHVVFNSARQLTADGPPDSQETVDAVYEWANGEVRFVSELPSGDPAQIAAGGGDERDVGQFHPGEHVISDDGQRIFFSDITLGRPGRLYVREGGSVTRLVSVSERAGDDPAAAHRTEFHGARASDGGVAFLSATDKLTDDATAGGPADDAVTPDLYRWEADAPAGDRMTDLTTADGGGGGVLGVAAIADDARTVFFAASGDLAAGAVPGSPNLFVWRAGQGVAHVAVLDGGDLGVWDNQRLQNVYRDARISQDGDRLLFSSRAQLTSYDNAGHVQVYLYDASDDALTCVSCNPLTSSSGADADLFPAETSASSIVYAPYTLSRNLSADGSRAFFETSERLVASDTNGKADVYRWDEGSGIALVSSGQGNSPSEFVDASETGDDVFFTTRQRLVGSDVDDQVDVYDARVGGGLSAPPAASPCQGDSCQEQLSGAPGLVDLATTGLAGRGDVLAPPRAALSLRRISATQRARLARGGRILLAVRVSRSGRVRLVARARIAGRTFVVARGARQARARGVVRVPVRLSRSARRRLADGHRLRLSISIRLGGASDSRALNLRRAR